MPALGPMLRRWREEETDGTLDRLRAWSPAAGGHEP